MGSIGLHVPRHPPPEAQWRLVRRNVLVRPWIGYQSAIYLYSLQQHFVKRIGVFEFSF